MRPPSIPLILLERNLVAIPSIQQLKDPIFQRDNVNPHTIAFLRNSFGSLNIPSSIDDDYNMICEILYQLPVVIIDLPRQRYEE